MYYYADGMSAFWESNFFFNFRLFLFIDYLFKQLYYHSGEI